LKYLVLALITHFAISLLLLRIAKINNLQLTKFEKVVLAIGGVWVAFFVFFYPLWLIKFYHLLDWIKEKFRK